MCDGKLRTYVKFKSQFEIENCVINIPFHKRRIFTRFHISAYDLAIEKGRHMPIPKKPDIKSNFCDHIKARCMFQM